MNCEKCLDRLDDLVEDELAAPIAAQINRHVFACSGCAAELTQLKREKEIYRGYLFNAEPSTDLAANFQARLKAEARKTLRAAELPARARKQAANPFGFWRLSLPAAMAVLLAVFGISLALLKFIPSETSIGGEFVAETKTDFVQPKPTQTGEFNEHKPANFSAKSAGGNNFPWSKNIKNGGVNKSLKTENVAAAKAENVSNKAVENKKRMNYADRKRKLADAPSLSEEESQNFQARLLEKQINRQVEKVELLLRSFRNARTLENGASFDVAYERQQARKLLDKNVELRRNAENYGTFYTEEILGKVEPLLLDIANLESEPSSEKVSDIRNRVKNQSIIASLQVYK